MQNNIIVEGAGGLLVPIDNNYFIIDLIKKLLPLILVSSTKLGTINHTLLSISEIIKKDVDLRASFYWRNFERCNKYNRRICKKYL